MWFEVLFIGILLFIIFLILFVVFNRREIGQEKYKNEMNRLYRELNIDNKFTDESIKIFQNKEEKIRKLINERFPSGLTNSKFIVFVDNLNDIFIKTYNKCMQYLELDPEYITEKHKDEIAFKMDLLKSILKQMGTLEAELIITDEDGTNIETIKELAKELKEITNSIQEYE